MSSKSKIIKAESQSAEDRLLTRFQRQGKIVFCFMQGELDFYTVHRCKSKVERILEAGVRKFLLDMRKITYVDSTGIGFLAHLQRTMTEKRGRMICLEPESSQMKKILCHGWIFSTLTVVKTQEEAMHLFCPKGDKQAEGNQSTAAAESAA